MKALVRGYSDFWAGVGGDGAGGEARDGEPTTLQMARVLEPLAMSSCWAAMVSAVSPDG